MLLNFEELVILGIQSVFINLQHVLQNACCFCVDLILYLFISHVKPKLSIREDTENIILRIISDVITQSHVLAR